MSMRRGQAEGQVFDLGYRSYEGPREGRNRARKAIYSDGLKTAMGIGRGGRAKILPWIFIAASVAPALVWVALALAINGIGGEGTSDEIGLPSYSDYYSGISFVLFLFAAAAAPELLCPDRRNGVINLYFVRPITSTDYIFVKWFAFLTIMLLVAWLPQIVLLLGLTLSAQQPGDYLTDNWEDIPRFLGAGIGMAIYVTSLAMLAGSFTTRRAYAAIFLIGLLVVSTPIAALVSESVDGAVGEWVALINLTAIPLHFNDWLFGSTSPAFEGSKVAELPLATRVGVFAGVTVAAIIVMWNRYRKLSV